MDLSLTYESIDKKEQRQRFNLAAFGRTFEPGETTIAGHRRRKKEFTKEKYDEIVRGLRDHENTGGLLDVKFKEFSLKVMNVGPNGTPVEHLLYRGNCQNHDSRIVLHQEMVFDAVYSIHESTLHKKVNVMRTIAASMYYNVTEQHCRILVETCSVCKSKDTSVVVPSPLRSIALEGRFRDKVTICAVDYSHDPIPDSNGVVMKYLLVMQDEATKFTLLRPVPGINVQVVHDEVKFMLSVVGYPKKEVRIHTELLGHQAGMIMNIIHRRECGCQHLSGPVDNIVSNVQSAISVLGASPRSESVPNDLLGCNKTNWLTLIPETMEELNKFAYSNVFGIESSSRSKTEPIPIHIQPLQNTKSKVRSLTGAQSICPTSGHRDEELPTVTPTTRLTTTEISGVIARSPDKKGCNPPNVHTSDFQVPEEPTNVAYDNNVEDSESLSMMHPSQNQSSDGQSPSIMHPSHDQESDNTPTVALDDAPDDESPTTIPPAQGQVPEISPNNVGDAPDDESPSTIPPAQGQVPEISPNNVNDAPDSESLSTIPPAQGQEPDIRPNVTTELNSTTCKRIMIKQTEHPIARAELCCGICDSFSIHGRPVLAIGRESYYNCFLDESIKWDIDLVNTFGALKSHRSHRRGIIYMDPRAPYSLDVLLKLSAESDSTAHANILKLPPEVQVCIASYIGIPDTVESIVTVIAKDNRSVVMELKLHPHCTAVVYDASPNKKNEDLKYWTEYQEFVRQRFGIDGTRNKMKWLTRYYKRLTDFRRPINIHDINESDSGPIACRFLWELLAPGEADRTVGRLTKGRGNTQLWRLDDDVDEWREQCIGDLKSMVQMYQEDMFLNEESNARNLDLVEGDWRNLVVQAGDDNTVAGTSNIGSTSTIVDEIATEMEDGNVAAVEIVNTSKTDDTLSVEMQDGEITHDTSNQTPTQTSANDKMNDDQSSATMNRDVNASDQNVGTTKLNVMSVLNGHRCQTVRGTPYRIAYPKLLCEHCDRHRIYGEQSLAVAEGAFYEGFSDPTRWWNADMVSTFGLLKCHETHRDDMIFVDAGTPSTRNDIKPRSWGAAELPSTVRSIVTVALKECHIVVMQLKLHPDCTTVVYDGMSKHAEHDLVKWERHEEYIMARYGLKKTGTGPKWIMRHYKASRDFGRRLDIQQKNSFDCGPIACRVIWELFQPGQFDEKYGHTIIGRGGTPSKIASKKSEDWRNMCLLELKEMIGKHTKDMFVIKKKKRRNEENNEIDDCSTRQNKRQK